MGVVERAADLPVLRPLVAWDKAEIVAEAKDIGTYEVSALPAEDCCTLFASPLAETRAAPDKISLLEAKLDVAETVEELLASAELVRPRRDRALDGHNWAAPRPVLQPAYGVNIQD
jgi:thiamine biosynthesis protein ThiI